mmetsp:Transcript_128088/g.370765  ORF Transcript_128088/g.370765 Transcript_128088/m.370765 type:complete len:220 (-) Transcript_128088:1111-1770(-)
MVERGPAEDHGAHALDDRNGGAGVRGDAVDAEGLQHALPHDAGGSLGPRLREVHGDSLLHCQRVRSGGHLGHALNRIPRCDRGEGVRRAGVAPDEQRQRVDGRDLRLRALGQSADVDEHADGCEGVGLANGAEPKPKVQGVDDLAVHNLIAAPGRHLREAVQRRLFEVVVARGLLEDVDDQTQQHVLQRLRVHVGKRLHEGLQDALWQRPRPLLHQILR